MHRDVISSCSKQEGDTEATQRMGLGSYQESKSFLEFPDIIQLHLICQHCIVWLSLAAREAGKYDLLTVFADPNKKGSVSDKEVENAHC